MRRVIIDGPVAPAVQVGRRTRRGVTLAGALHIALTGPVQYQDTTDKTGETS